MRIEEFDCKYVATEWDGGWFCHECDKLNHWRSKAFVYNGKHYCRECALMRNANNIYPFSTILARAWMEVPYMRFGQLIENLSSFARTKYGKKDLFYVEDEELLSMLKEYVKFANN